MAEFDSIAASIATISMMIIFFLNGKMTSDLLTSSRDLWFPAQTSGGATSTASLVAGNLSFGMGVFYFMLIAPYYGWVVLVVSLGTWLIGFAIMGIFVSRDKIIDFSKYDGVHQYVRDVTGSRSLASVVLISNLLFYFGLLVAELYLSAGVFRLLVPGAPPEIAGLAGVSFVAILSLMYIRMGGMSAVLASDLWQFAMIMLGLVVFTAAVFAAYGERSYTFSLDMLGPSSEVDTGSLLLYAAFASVVNITWAIPQIAQWQRNTATKKRAQSSAIFRGAAVLFIVHGLYIGISQILSANGSPIRTISDLFEPLGALGGGTFFQIGGALVFAGIVASIFSTVDSACMALATGLRFWRFNFSATKQEATSTQCGSTEAERKALSLIAAAIFFLAILSYVGLSGRFGNFSSGYLAVCFSFVSLVVIPGPLIFYSFLTDSELAGGNPEVGFWLKAAHVLAGIMILAGVAAQVGFAKPEYAFWAPIAAFVLTMSACHFDEGMRGRRMSKLAPQMAGGE